MKCYVYMVECENGTLYTGITDNLIRRMEQHRKGIGARYVRMTGFRSVALVEEHPDRSNAMKRENLIKSLAKKEKMRIAVENMEKTKVLLDRWGMPKDLCKSFKEMKAALEAD